MKDQQNLDGEAIQWRRVSQLDEAWDTLPAEPLSSDQYRRRRLRFALRHPLRWAGDGITGLTGSLHSAIGKVDISINAKVYKQQQTRIALKFLRAAGLRYSGEERTLGAHLAHLMREPHIPLSDIAQGLGLSFSAANQLLNSLERMTFFERDVQAKYTSVWAEPLGRVLRPLIAKAVHEEYGVLAQGYEFEREQGRPGPAGRSQ